MDADKGLIGATVIDGSQVLIGHVAALLVDPETLQGLWLLVTLDGSAGEAVLPAPAASVAADGRLVVPYAATVVAGAPKLTGSAVTAEVADRLLRYYELVR